MATLTCMDTPNIPTPDHPPKRTRLSDAEIEALRALHRNVRAEVARLGYEANAATGYATPGALRRSEKVRRAVRVAGQRHRIALLAWAFVRGLPYRRAEPLRHLQVVDMTPNAVVRIDSAPPASIASPVIQWFDNVRTEGIVFYEHRRPDVREFHAFLKRFLPDVGHKRVSDWLDAEGPRASPEKIAGLVRRYQDRMAAKRKAERERATAKTAAAQLSLPLAG